jgi:Holliday junction resolvasome RuvABC DNA-binding subunit
VAAADLDSTNATKGASLFITSGTGATTANNLMRLTDLGGYDETININTASVEELDRLPGIGKTKAQAMVCSVALN